MSKLLTGLTDDQIGAATRAFWDDDTTWVAVHTVDRIALRTRILPALAAVIPRGTRVSGEEREAAIERVLSRVFNRISNPLQDSRDADIIRGTR